MKFLVSQLSYFIEDKQTRRNLGALRTYFFFLLGVIVLYSAIFHFIMAMVEGQEHSWLTGFYWTLTVMSTLGFGDITFHTDIGRLFSILVLMTGIILLLVMLPFAFIRHFYAPWLEAQLRNQAPRACLEDLSGHVIICRRDSITPGLIRRLSFNHIPYVILEPDPVVAAQMMSSDIEVVTGEIDHRQTYESLRVDKAKLIFANAEDTTNTNITLTAREVSPTVPILALAEEEASLDIFTLSGATYTLPLKHILGQQLAARVGAGIGSIHIVGRFKDLEIAEFLIHHTPLAGKSLAEIGLRRATGVNVVGVWNKGRFQPIQSDRQLSNTDVPVAIGTKDQVKRLDEFLGSVPNDRRPVLVIGMGKVGLSTAKALKERGLQVHVIEKDERLRQSIGSQFDRATYGDAADLRVLEEAGINEASAVALTTNSDAVNIHLTVYCRRLKPDLNLVSRITRERNIEAIYRAGADFVLSYAFLGREYVTALLLGREPIMVGEGADFFSVPVPDVLVGGDLGSSQIGSKTGLIVIAIERNESTITNPMPGTILERDARLLMLGTIEQRDSFAKEFT